MGRSEPGGKAIDDLTKRVARLVALYIECVWPHEERPGGTPDEPMQDAKGSTNPPIGEWVHALMDSNRVASRYLSRELEIARTTEGKTSDEGSAVVSYSEVLMAVREDPGAVGTWRDRNPAMLAAYKETCEHVAKGVVFIRGATRELKELKRRMNLDYDDKEAFVVRRDPTDEALEVVMPGDEPTAIEPKAHRDEMKGRTRKGQKIDTMHTRRLMVEQLEQLEASTDYRGLAAMEILSERKAKEGKDWSVASIRKARECVNRERRGETIEEKPDRYCYGGDGEVA